MMRSIKGIVALALTLCMVVCTACHKVGEDSPSQVTSGVSTTGTSETTRQESSTGDINPPQTSSAYTTTIPAVTQQQQPAQSVPPTQPTQKPTQSIQPTQSTQQPTQSTLPPQTEATKPSLPAPDVEQAPTEGFVPDENEGPLMPL